jgi:hypothetical protein
MRRHFRLQWGCAGVALRPAKEYRDEYISSRAAKLKGKQDAVSRLSAGLRIPGTLYEKTSNLLACIAPPTGPPHELLN